MARIRHLALLLLSVLLICVTGVLAIDLTARATSKAEDSRLQDRQSLQATLGGLGKQYLLFSLKEGLDYASTGTWDLRPGDPADTARLQTFLSHAVLLNYGAALVDLGGNTLSSYTSGPGLPPSTDPGFAPMVKDLLRQRPDVSSVMTVDGIHVIAMAVPVTVSGQVRAVFVGFVRLDTSALETYVHTLRYGRTGTAYVLDSAGTVVAATNATEIGRHLGIATAERAVAKGRTGSYVDTHTHDVVAYTAFGLGGWGGATLQSVDEFYGPLRAGRLHIQLAIVALLILAAVLVLVLNHKREAARRRFQAQLAYQAAHDGLTGLYNHSVFHERLDQALSRARRRQTDLAVLYLDLDRFKPVNDGFGHETGDRVLAEVGIRLQAVTRAEDVVARMGGDEFAVLIEDIDSPAAAEQFARRIVEDLRVPFAHAHGHESVGVSVGIAYCVRGTGAAETIVRDADLAMYRAKEAGGNGFDVATRLEPVT